MVLKAKRNEILFTKHFKDCRILDHGPWAGSYKSHADSHQTDLGIKVWHHVIMIVESRLWLTHCMHCRYWLHHVLVNTNRYYSGYTSQWIMLYPTPPTCWHQKIMPKPRVHCDEVLDSTYAKTTVYSDSIGWLVQSAYMITGRNTETYWNTML